jgi:hypothetical protein
MSRRGPVGGVDCRICSILFDTRPSKVSYKKSTICHKDVIYMEIVMIEIWIDLPDFDKSSEDRGYEMVHGGVVPWPFFEPIEKRPTGAIFHENYTLSRFVVFSRILEVVHIDL